MDTRILATTPNVTLATTTPRVTPTPPSATKFGDVLANTAVQSAEQAMTALPGGPMMALALRGGAASVPLGTTTTALSTASGASGAAAGSKSPEGPTTTASASSPFGAAMGIPGISGATAGTTGAAGTGGSLGSAASDAITGASTTGMDPASVQSSLQQSADMNMYMLTVQQQVQQQGQQFTTLSNVMKAQYDTVKNAIGNIR